MISTNILKKDVEEKIYNGTWKDSSLGFYWKASKVKMEKYLSNIVTKLFPGLKVIIRLDKSWSLVYFPSQKFTRIIHGAAAKCGITN